VRVVDYRVVRMNYDTQGNEAVVQVEIDYYTLTEKQAAEPDRLPEMGLCDRKRY